MPLRSYPFTTISTEATLFLRNSAKIDDKGYTNIENTRQVNPSQRPISSTLNDDDGEDDDDCFCGMVLTGKGCLALFTAWTIVRDPDHWKSLTLWKQDLTCTEPDFRLCC